MTNYQDENKPVEEIIPEETLPLEGEQTMPEEAEVIVEERVENHFWQIEKQALEAQLAEANEQIIRLQADFINFRKRKEKEAADSIIFGNVELIKLILPSLDDLERTLKVIENTDNLAAIQQGLRLVSNNFNRTLSKIGLEAIESVGTPFNSEYHEAISTIPVVEDDKKGIVLDEAIKGYRYKDRIIRVSQVIIGE